MTDDPIAEQLRRGDRQADKVRAARHESAHAVIAALHQLPVGSICLDAPDTPPYEWNGETFVDSSTADVQTRVRCALAGRAYEQFKDGQAQPLRGQIRVADTDFSDADSVADEAVVDAQWDEALQEVEAHLDAIEAFAEDLLDALPEGGCSDVSFAAVRLRELMQGAVTVDESGSR